VDVPVASPVAAPARAAAPLSPAVNEDDLKLIREWNAKRRVELNQRESEEAAKRAKNRDNARKVMMKFNSLRKSHPSCFTDRSLLPLLANHYYYYPQELSSFYDEKQKSKVLKLKSNRQLEKAEVEKRDAASSSSNPFEKVVKLVDLNIEAEGKDKSRFKSVLIQLKAKALTETRGN
jgi:hypothetical protein